MSTGNLGDSLRTSLNRLAGTTGLTEVGAANAWAGTSGLTLNAALNAVADTTGVGLSGVLRLLTAGVGDGHGEVGLSTFIDSTVLIGGAYGGGFFAAGAYGS